MQLSLLFSRGVEVKAQSLVDHPINIQSYTGTVQQRRLVDSTAGV